MADSQKTTLNIQTPSLDATAAIKREKMVTATFHALVLVLSLALIVFISYDTFQNINFLENHLYMTFQFWVCIVFLLDFFIEWWLSADRKSYVGHHWFYLLISIPYLNIIDMFDLEFPMQALYFVRFVPLVRGAYALAMVVGYFSGNRAYSLLAQYMAILVSVVYFSGLVFYYEEHEINSDVNTYWDALYWAAMNCDTVGSYISAVTVVGKVLSIVLAVAGMMMLPLFTVYITTRVKTYNDRKRAQQQQWRAIFDARRYRDPDTQTASTTPQQS